MYFHVISKDGAAAPADRDAAPGVEVEGAEGGEGDAGPLCFKARMMEERRGKEREAALPLTAHRRGLRLCRGAANGAAAEERKRRVGVDDEGGVPNGLDLQRGVELR